MGSGALSLSGMRQMTQPAKAQEPSMEEILASIRRIIADDDAAKAPPPEPVAAAVPLRPASPPPPPPAPPPSAAVLDEMLADLNATPPPATLVEEDVDVLELTEAMTAL